MSLEDASQKRKERLALLKSAKRKRDGDSEVADALSREREEVESKMKFRNYDPETEAPKLGFLHDPTSSEATVEARVQELVAETHAEDVTRASDGPLDVATIQSKRPNWDLKRDLERRMEPLRARQEVVVARLVRERLLAAKAGAQETLGGDLAQQVEQRERDLVQESRQQEV